jgi:hypothetical protein
MFCHLRPPHSLHPDRRHFLGCVAIKPGHAHQSMSIYRRCRASFARSYAAYSTWRTDKRISLNPPPPASPLVFKTELFHNLARVTLLNLYSWYEKWLNSQRHSQALLTLENTGNIGSGIWETSGSSSSVVQEVTQVRKLNHSCL